MRVPVLIKNLIPNIPDALQIRSKDNEMKKHYKADYDRRYGVKPLSPLEPDTPVLIKMDNEEDMGETWISCSSKSRKQAISCVYTDWHVTEKSKASTACWYASYSSTCFNPSIYSGERIRSHCQTLRK